MVVAGGWRMEDGDVNACVGCCVFGLGTIKFCRCGLDSVRLGLVGKDVFLADV